MTIVISVSSEKLLPFVLGFCGYANHSVPFEQEAVHVVAQSDSLRKQAKYTQRSTESQNVTHQGSIAADFKEMVVLERAKRAAHHDVLKVGRPPIRGNTCFMSEQKAEVASTLGNRFIQADKAMCNAVDSLLTRGVR